MERAWYCSPKKVIVLLTIDIVQGKYGGVEEPEVPNIMVASASMEGQIDREKSRYPYCIVWTPIPLLTWFFPFIGHMGICYSTGVIRDFAGPYYVSEDNMAFGNPTRYLKLDYTKASNWDRSVYEASEEYKTRTHKLICDNCHSHVAMSLNLMKYRGMTSWNMIYLAAITFVGAKYVGVGGFLKTWLPSVILYSIIIAVCTIKL
ncbi:unnamed protein product [Allacma fusca]|uniref:Transmembrane protein 222 n=1 Tax=Allacma fusca TaxID=39272 RepID=A0A8J2KRA1_9HEXA|nr:unnamed protein product [Allacma fusca]